MKKELLQQFAKFKLTRQSTNQIKGGYGDMENCNGVWCPSSGGSCSYIGKCKLNGNIAAHYSCHVNGTPQSVKDSIVTKFPNVPHIFQGDYDVTCTGYGPA